ncbi:MAG: hypothetical protein LUE88_01650 [Clostridiales bacterium]|nr:hypothetical protein [Clostridiales bacterium]
MICIGVSGTDRFMHKLAEKYTDAGYTTEICYESGKMALKYVKNAEINDCEIFIMPMDTPVGFKYDILICTAEFNHKELYKIKQGGCVIINSDDCRDFPYIIPKGINVVTCGVNSRSAVTFSGIAENRNGRETIQCCIQRNIKTMSGRKIEPQEFAVNILGKYPISEVLSIIAAAVTGDIEETVTSGRLFSSD